MSTLQTQTAAGTFAADPAVIAALQSGQAFTSVLDDDPAGRSVRLEAVLDSIADLTTRFVRVGNPLRSPLTIERLLIQAAGNDAESYYDRTAAELTRILAGPRTDETRTILVVEQAETLDAEAVRVLRDMSAFFPAGTPTLQILFAGHTAFRAMLDGAPPAPVPPVPVVQAAPPPTLPPEPPATPAPEPVRAAEPVELLLPPPLPPRRRRVWLVLLLVLVLAGVVAAVLWTSYPDQAARLLGLVRERIEQWRAMVMPPART